MNGPATPYDCFIILTASKLTDTQMHASPLANSLTDPSSKSPISSHHIQLPSVAPTTPSPFMWGEYDSGNFSAYLSDTYLETVHWQRNVFQIPQGNDGKEFVKEVSRLFRAYAEASA